MAEIGWEGGLTIATLVVGLIVMAGDWVGPDFVFAGMVGVLTAARVITVNQSTAGFSSSGLLTVVVLYVVAEGIGQTGGMERALNLVLGRHPNVFWAQVRLFIPVMITSAFLNNTPIVALLIPIVIAWCRRQGVSPKKLLIPLSYAAVFGGTLTLIGTSTNLVIAALQEKRYAKSRPDDANFNFFYITPYGLAYAIFGMCYTLMASPFLLPGEDTRRHSDLLFVARVRPESPVVNKTVLEAGLRSLERLFLVAVERLGHVSHAVGPDFLLEANDLLYFSGQIKQAKHYSEQFNLDLLTNETETGEGKGFAGNRDLKYVEDGAQPPSDTAQLLQATVKKGTDIIGSTIREISFRSRFHAAVLAVKRGNVHQPGRLGDIVVLANDVLVLMTENKSVVDDKEFKSVFKEIELLDLTLEKEFLSGMRVTSKFSGIGKTITQAGLRGIEGLYLVGIDRANGETLRVVQPDTIIHDGDLLWFSGSIENVYFVLKIPGLEHHQAPQISQLKVGILNRQLVQVSVAYDSPISGQTVRQAAFRTKYDAVVLAIHRQGHRLSADVRDVPLQPGDVLLLDTGSSFPKRFKDDRTFSIIKGVNDTSPVKTNRMWIAIGLATVMIGTQIWAGAADANPEYINLFTAGILTAGLMLLTGCFNGKQARDSIDWRVYVTIAFAFAFSTAMETSNVAQAIADVFTDISESIGGKAAAFVAIYITTAFLSEIVSNNAAGALMYPIAARLGDALGVVPSRMSVVVMLGASAGFTLPYSYQTNLMVFAAGDYRFLEFAKFGLPCQLFMIVSVIIIFVLEDTIGVAIGISVALFGLLLAGPLVWLFISEPTKEKLRFWVPKAKLPERQNVKLID